MSKKGMARPDEHISSDNEAARVPLIQGRAKHGEVKANPIIAGTEGPSLKVYHTKPFPKEQQEKPVPGVYPVIDTDLGRDNVENDLTAADIQDMR